MKTVRRDWIMRQIDKGNIEAKCTYNYTDDFYAWEDRNRNIFSTDWLPVRISRPKFDSSYRYSDVDRIDGHINFMPHELKSRSGSAWWNEDGTITLLVHSNLCYTLRIKQA